MLYLQTTLTVPRKSWRLLTQHISTAESAQKYSFLAVRLPLSCTPGLPPASFGLKQTPPRFLSGLTLLLHIGPPEMCDFAVNFH